MGYYWIDAICIDQDNSHERALQVAMMGSIYKASRCCIAYLGDNDGLAELGLGVIRTIFKGMPWSEYTPENPRIMTKCFHHFHLGCIYEWKERSDSCPVCGKVILLVDLTANLQTCIHTCMHARVCCDFCAVMIASLWGEAFHTSVDAASLFRKFGAYIVGLLSNVLCKIGSEKVVQLLWIMQRVASTSARYCRGNIHNCKHLLLALTH